VISAEILIGVVKAGASRGTAQEIKKFPGGQNSDSDPPAFRIVARVAGDQDGTRRSRDFQKRYIPGVRKLSGERNSPDWFCDGTNPFHYFSGIVEDEVELRAAQDGVVFRKSPVVHIDSEHAFSEHIEDLGADPLRSQNSGNDHIRV
jgi:hypothetical protein